MNSKVLEKAEMDSYERDNGLKKCLESGYKEMSRINLSLAEEAVASDNEAQLLAEQNLRSVNLSDS
ncbi:MAG: hypothetical protein IKW62_05245 [Clostridia bacterium]|nr:hypothetical protein [Clostridia bacterium]